MNDERKLEILFLWNKIEELLYGTPRMDVKPQETFGVIEETIVANFLVNKMKDVDKKDLEQKRDAYRKFLVDALAMKLGVPHRDPPGGMPPYGLPGIPGMSPSSPLPGMAPQPFGCPPGMPPGINAPSEPPGARFAPGINHPLEPPGARMAPGCSGMRDPADEREENDRCKTVKDLVWLVMLRLGSEYEDEKTYKAVKLVLEGNGFKLFK